jgi:hypothetical protein
VYFEPYYWYTVAIF